jgi:hypothetical protein
MRRKVERLFWILISIEDSKIRIALQRWFQQFVVVGFFDGLRAKLCQVGIYELGVQQFSLATKCTRQILLASVARENMLSPKKAAPIFTP